MNKGSIVVAVLQRSWSFEPLYKLSTLLFFTLLYLHAVKHRNRTVKVSTTVTYISPFSHSLTPPLIFAVYVLFYIVCFVHCLVLILVLLFVQGNRKCSFLPGCACLYLYLLTYCHVLWKLNDDDDDDNETVKQLGSRECLFKQDDHLHLFRHFCHRLYHLLWCQYNGLKWVTR